MSIPEELVSRGIITDVDHLEFYPMANIIKDFKTLEARAEALFLCADAQMGGYACSYIRRNSYNDTEKQKLDWCKEQMQDWAHGTGLSNRVVCLAAKKLYDYIYN